MSKLSEQREQLVEDKKSGASWRWMGILLIVAGVAWGAYYYFYYVKPVSNLDGFAKCISSKGARMYGAWWCPHCAEQKEEFGYAFQYVNYTECSPEGQKTMNDTCKQAGIQHFPTWQFPDGSRKEGTLPLSELSERTGCKLP
jgi:hypothetical protein